MVHADMKTAFLQGQEYVGGKRDVVAQLPPEAGYPPHIGAVLIKPAYGINDAPRMWWNRLDNFLHKEVHCVSARADRCCDVLYQAKATGKSTRAVSKGQKEDRPADWVEQAVDYLLDPITGSKAANMTVLAVILIHVDDLLIAASKGDCWTDHDDCAKTFQDWLGVGE